MVWMRPGRPVLATIAALAVSAEIHLPGDAEFHTRLESLAATNGVLRPKFHPEVYDYTLVIEDEVVKKVTFHFTLDTARYSATNLPDVLLDGRRFVYSPADANEHDVVLDESIGPFDGTLHIKVADPAGRRGVFRGENQHTYAIRILQAPEFERITTPRNLTLVSLAGRVWESDPPFSFEHPARSYTYRPRGGDVFRLYVECTQWANILLIDGEQVHDTSDIASSGKLVTLSHLRASRSIQCMYKDSRWAPEGVGNIFQVDIEETVDLSDLKVAMVVQEDQGYCAMRADKSEEYFRCRVGADSADFLLTFSDQRVAGALATDSGAEHLMYHGVEATLRIPKHPATFTLTVEGDTAPRRWPVEVLRVARCSTLRCPHGLVHKPSSERARLCLQETCSADDVDACCMKSPRCDTLDACPEGTRLRRDAASVGCGGPVCDAGRDADVCCSAPAMCDTFACGVGQRLRDDAKGIPCYSKVCDVLDADRCCEACGRNDTDCTLEVDFKLCPKCRGATDLEACCDAAIRAAREEEERRDFWAERSEHYDAVGCFPEAINKCFNRNCYYDEGCRGNPPRDRGLGCWAGGVDQRCRFCGFNQYKPCPKDTYCFDTFRSPCEDWDEQKFAHCQATLHISCPARERRARENTLMMKDIVAADARRRPSPLSDVAKAGVAGLVCVAAAGLAAVLLRDRRRPSRAERSLMLRTYETSPLVE